MITYNVLDRKKEKFKCAVCGHKAQYKFSIEIGEVGENGEQFDNICINCAINIIEKKKKEYYKGAKLVSLFSRPKVRDYLFRVIPKSKVEKREDSDLESNIMTNETFRKLISDRRLWKYKAWHYFLGFGLRYKITPRIEKYMKFFMETRELLIDSGELARLFNTVKYFFFSKRRADVFFQDIARFIQNKGFISPGYYRVLKQKIGTPEFKQRLARIMLHDNYGIELKFEPYDPNKGRKILINGALINNQTLLEKITAALRKYHEHNVSSI